MWWTTLGSSIIREWRTKRGEGSVARLFPTCKMVKFDFPNTRCTYVPYNGTAKPWPGAPITQRLVPDGRHSNRHPRNSLSLPSYLLLPLFLHLCLRPSITSLASSSKSVRESGRDTKRKRQSDELGEGPELKKEGEKFKGQSRKNRKRKRVRETEKERKESRTA